AVWDTPWWGVALSGAFRYTTGQAWTPTLGVDANNDTNSTPDRPTLGCADPTACKAGEGDHLGRNSLRQPNFAQLDMRLGKGFSTSSTMMRAAFGPPSFVDAQTLRQSLLRQVVPRRAAGELRRRSAPQSVAGSRRDRVLHPGAAAIGARHRLRRRRVARTSAGA